MRWRPQEHEGVRVSNNKKYSCDLLTPFPHGKPLMSKGYVYYAANRYKDTLYNETGAGTNYAYKKKTQQSSTYELYGIQYTSDKAVDGSHNTDGLKPPYFAHTLDSYWNELFPWWMVDLAQDITVTGIRIRNRKEWDSSGETSSESWSPAVSVPLLAVGVSPHCRCSACGLLFVRLLWPVCRSGSPWPVGRGVAATLVMAPCCRNETRQLRSMQTKSRFFFFFIAFGTGSTTSMCVWAHCPLRPNTTTSRSKETHAATTTRRAASRTRRSCSSSASRAPSEGATSPYRSPRTAPTARSR
ncbi:uncharacterized protein [Dermacentor albipictus]|uniref:uncharacterized protein isoform X2 n=1 Tax=Dermacentor albipictus TaxID=60249 RepID=UPI0038FD2948